MCKRECIGDYYRPCNHWVFDYETGELVDCNEPKCRDSSSHIHKGKEWSCDCAPSLPYDAREGESKVRNMFHKLCPKCAAATSSRGR